MDDVWPCTKPSMFDWVFVKGPDLDYAKVEFAAPIPPSIIEDGPSAFNEGPLVPIVGLLNYLRLGLL